MSSDTLPTPAHRAYSSTAGKGVKKQQSATFSTGARRRTPTDATSSPRPTSEFGWQLALQKIPSTLKESLVEEEPQKELWRKAAELDGAGGSHESPPPPYQYPSSKSPRSEGAAQSSSSVAAEDSAGLSQRYTGKDIGWQLALHGKVIPPSREERNRDVDTNPYSGADLGSRESPRPSIDSNSLPLSPERGDTFEQLNLDEAAKHYRGFSTTHNSPATPFRQSPPHSPSLRTPKKDFLNNPFLAIRLQEHAAKHSGNLIDLDDDRPLPQVPQYPPVPQESRWARPSEEYEPREELLDCQYCPNQVSVTQISQIPDCLHVVCHTCLVNHIESELSDSHFPIKCPMCSLLQEETSDNTGVITREIVDQLSLPQSTAVIYGAFEVSAHSSTVFCPKCKETMLVDRVQYLEERFITCPLGQCGHRWCKSCLKGVSGSGNADTKHKCKPSKEGIRTCPGCGCQGRRVADDNYIQCRGVGCALHFCFKCGNSIADGASVSDIPAAITAHYNSCTRYSKDKCKVQ